MPELSPSIAEPYRYVWLVWAGTFLLVWVLLYALCPRQRRAMRWASLYTAPFGLSEPLFVPAYWNPPSVFDLAQRTGFDLESLIFCFAIGGVGSVLYNVVTGSRLEAVPAAERHRQHHRWHRPALLTPFVTLPVLLVFPWNPIYPAILALAAGALATVACRPDLKTKTLIGAALFCGYYFVFMLALDAFVPGYIEQVWNLPALSGVRVLGIPAEELAFGLAFGAYWAGIHEHMRWRRVTGPGGTARSTARLRAADRAGDRRRGAGAGGGEPRMRARPAPHGGSRRPARHTAGAGGRETGGAACTAPTAAS
jgi:hypothetical protein